MSMGSEQLYAYPGPLSRLLPWGGSLAAFESAFLSRGGERQAVFTARDGAGV